MVVASLGLSHTCVTMFFSLERDIALSIGRVPERDDFNEIIVQKETALKDLELEIAKLVRRLLKESLRSPLQVSPEALHMPFASVATEIIAAWRSSVMMKHKAWGYDLGSAPDPL